MLFQSVSLSLFLVFSSHIIDWNVTLLLCKDTRRMSTWTTSTANERELIMIHLHSFFNLSLTHSTHSPQKELRYWYFVKAFDLSLLSIFLLHHYWLPLFRRTPFDLFRHHQLRIFYFRNVVPRHVLNVKCSKWNLILCEMF